MDTERQDMSVFYHRLYPMLVGQLTLAAGGDRGAAEEVVQEAFTRLIPRWQQVSRYDVPEAWVRRVALRLLSNRQRKARNWLRAITAAPPAPDVPELDALSVDVTRALARLPAGQRHVVVLHHLLDLSIAEIARDLGVSEGTVKSRLHRGRSALQSTLGTEHACAS